MTFFFSLVTRRNFALALYLKTIMLVKLAALHQILSAAWFSPSPFLFFCVYVPTTAYIVLSGGLGFGIGVVFRDVFGYALRK